ncbi:hypothetical protein COCC4DRAFT_29353 [Bipolaris maydis ATCC 48331]|uniref:Uncharacterized protein n=2 Tax=Cochliobolus heterostrophus TaxID=5016 RepID=M2TE44_COCH5|nr:uncharacterized protein COCC4DRAFT_29353 [Bipolaris maydis ATCC 48331]EMD95745.1 hypothetical protein COCHEDRAFT_1019364 [Bipolaris maydis C5]ENI10604.1 hypothetical protein COCC4DRAFT_29353 [Bipolaris maydis ATCC 48331]
MSYGKVVVSEIGDFALDFMEIRLHPYLQLQRMQSTLDMSMAQGIGRRRVEFACSQH